ncbi:MAG: NADH-quinone oxidoreductase subunit J [Bacteroidetes bacterium]|nr:NADH-quinone oxidoreductase subunit J [Bacteroidota bacterium]
MSTLLLNIPVTQYMFYFLSFLAFLCAIMVVASKNPIHSILYLIITFFAIAGHYLLLNAQFLAVVHIIVYAGAIMVLFLYVLMMMNLNVDNEPTKHIALKIAAVVAGGLLLVVLVASLKGAETLNSAAPLDTQVGLIKNLGKTLFGEFLFPFEVSSILLLSAMVGAIMIGKKDPASEK